MKGGME